MDQAPPHAVQKEIPDTALRQKNRRIDVDLKLCVERVDPKIRRQIVIGNRRVVYQAVEYRFRRNKVLKNFRLQIFETGKIDLPKAETPLPALLEGGHPFRSMTRHPENRRSAVQETPGHGPSQSAGRTRYQNRLIGHLSSFPVRERFKFSTTRIIRGTAYGGKCFSR